jgi:hypothetical protein
MVAGDGEGRDPGFALTKDWSQEAPLPFTTLACYGVDVQQI